MIEVHFMQFLFLLQFCIKTNNDIKRTKKWIIKPRYLELINFDPYFRSIYNIIYSW